MFVRSSRLAIAALALTGGLSGCATSASGGGNDRVLNVAASINAWGSIVSQLGGSHVHETSIITNPNTDPHDYEPTPADGRVIAGAQLFVENGIGYDTWAGKALVASPDPHRLVINVGTLVGVPADGNPHRWYDPANVATVAAAVTTDLKKLDPTDAGYFAQQAAHFEHTGLARYHQLINHIKTRYAHTPVGASESIFAPLAQVLDLHLLTPPTFLRAISEGTDPSAADKATIDTQIAQHQIKVYVYNSQNSTPDVTAQVTACKKTGIPVVPVTETLSPARASFQQWQIAQLQALQAALSSANRK